MIELGIVVLIVGVLTAVAVPKYFGALDAFRVDAASRRIAADLRLARSYAQKTSVTQSVDFDAAADSYAVAGMPDPNRPAVSYAVSLPATEYVVDMLSATFGGGDIVQFDIYGKPSAAGSIVIKAGANQRTIQVDAIGNVSVN